MSRAAVLTAGWDRLAPRNPAGPLGAVQGASFGGTPFLPDELPGARLIVSAAFGANILADPATWMGQFVDITPVVLQDNGRTISIRVGRTDWSSVAYAATCSLAVKNLTGDFSAYNALARYWPNLVPGTPLWVQLYVGGVYYTRFFGEITGFTPSWDVTGNYAITLIQAAGVLQRIGGGGGQPVPLHSPLYRAIVASQPVAYWPLEDGSSATLAGSGVTGGAPLTVTSPTAPRFGSSKAAAGAAAAVDFAGGGTLAAPVPRGKFTTSWRIEFVADFTPGTGPTTTTDIPHILNWTTTGTIVSWDVYIFNIVGGSNPANMLIQLNYTTATNTGVGLLTSFTPYLDGQAHHYRIDASKSGSAILISFYIDGDLYQQDNGTTGTLGPITGVRLNPDNDSHTWMPTLGHVAVWQPYNASVDTVAATTGYVGETPAARFLRLCREENIPAKLVA